MNLRIALIPICFLTLLISCGSPETRQEEAPPTPTESDSLKTVSQTTEEEVTASSDSSDIETLAEMVNNGGNIPGIWMEKFSTEVADLKEAVSVEVSRVWSISKDFHAIVIMAVHYTGTEEHLFTYGNGIKDHLMISSLHDRDGNSPHRYTEYSWLGDRDIELEKHFLTQDDKETIILERWEALVTGDIIQPTKHTAAVSYPYSDWFIDHSPGITATGNQLSAAGKSIEFPDNPAIGKLLEYQDDGGISLIKIRRLNYTTIAFQIRVNDNWCSGYADFSPNNVQSSPVLPITLGDVAVWDYEVTECTSDCITHLYLTKDSQEIIPEDKTLLVLGMETPCRFSAVKDISLWPRE